MREGKLCWLPCTRCQGRPIQLVGMLLRAGVQRLLLLVFWAARGVFILQGVAFGLASVTVFAVASAGMPPWLRDTFVSSVMISGTFFVAGFLLIVERRWRVTRSGANSQPTWPWPLLLGLSLLVLPTVAVIAASNLPPLWGQIGTQLEAIGFWEGMTRPGHSGMVMLPLFLALFVPALVTAAALYSVAFPLAMLPLLVTRSPLFPTLLAMGATCQTALVLNGWIASGALVRVVSALVTAMADGADAEVLRVSGELEREAAILFRTSLALAVPTLGVFAWFAFLRPSGRAALYFAGDLGAARAELSDATLESPTPRPWIPVVDATARPHPPRPGVPARTGRTSGSGGYRPRGDRGRAAGGAGSHHGTRRGPAAREKVCVRGVSYRAVQCVASGFAVSFTSQSKIHRRGPGRRRWDQGQLIPRDCWVPCRETPAMLASGRSAQEYQEERLRIKSLFGFLSLVFVSLVTFVGGAGAAAQTSFQGSGSFTTNPGTLTLPGSPTCSYQEPGSLTLNWSTVPGQDTRSLPLTMPDVFVSGPAGTAMPQRSESPPARYGEAECGVSVASPHKLKHQRRSIAGGTATTHFFTVKVDGTTFRLFCITDASITGPSDDLYDTYRDGFLDDDPRQLVAERTVTLVAAVGREVHGAEPDGTHNMVRVFIVPGRTFGALISGPPQAVSSEEATRFLDSLQFEP